MISPPSRLGLHLTAALLGCGWAGCGAAQASAVLGNLKQPTVDDSEAVSLNQWQASAIRLSSSAGAWRVGSLTVRLSQRTPNRSFFFRIVGESAFRPDPEIVKVNFTLPAITGTGPQNVTLAATADPIPVLQPGQTYWLVAGVSSIDGDQAPGTGLYHWSYSATNVADAPVQPGWSFDSRIATAGTAGQNWAPMVASPFSFSIEASPENPSMTLARWRELNPGGSPDTTVFLTSDPDGNGLNGLLDFAFDAKRQNLPVIARDPATGGLLLEYIRWNDAPELVWRIEHSPDLKSWRPLEGLPSTATPSEALSQRIRVTLPTTAPDYFFRLAVLKK